MQEKRQGQRKEIVSDEPLNWPAKIVDGALVIEPISETTKHDDGSQDIIIKVPSLRLINEFKATNNIE
jgi:hypothetical protein